MGSPIIAIDARYVRERPSGIGAMVEAILRHIPQQMPEISFLLLRHPKAPIPLSSAPNVVEKTVSWEVNGPASLLFLSRVIDLSHVAFFHAPSNILPARLPTRTLVTIHDLMWLTSPFLCGARGIGGRVQTCFYRNGIRRALRSADHIIAISRATHRDILLAEPSTKLRCSIIEHGIDPKFSPASSKADWEEVARVRRQFAPGATEHILVVGRSAPYKNQSRSVQAFVRAYRDSPGTHLIVIQRLGHDACSFIKMAAEAGVSRRVHVVPPMNEKDLISLYRGALCLCHPSLQEGWGMPIGEAMACGCPVLTSNTSAMPEVVGDAAIIVDPTDVEAIAEGLRCLGKNHDLCTVLRHKGLKRAKLFSWDISASQIARVYRRMLTPRL